MAFDKNRFADPQSYTRAIIFTDGRIIEASVDLAAGSLAAKYPASFGGADIFMFGVAAGGADAANPELMHAVFEDYFLTGRGQLRSFSFALPEQSASVFGSPVSLQGRYDGGGVSGEAVLSYVPGGEGGLAGAWLTFATGTGPLHLPVEGDLRCSAGTCSLKAHVVHDVPPAAEDPFFKKGDLVVLQGSPDAFKGRLEAAVPETFEGRAETVVYNLTLGGT